MSVFTGVRLPDELAASVDEEAKNRGKNRSQIIIEAVIEHQRRAGASVPSVVEAEKMIIAKPERKPRAIAKPSEIQAERESEADKPAVLSGCQKHPGVGFPKAGGWWCPPCGRIV
jgi:metal-responsive CopG/Arc/MetJ family transcriptional regulator